jgi:hypothetical protein
MILGYSYVSYLTILAEAVALRMQRATSSSLEIKAVMIVLSVVSLTV